MAAQKEIGTFYCEGGAEEDSCAMMKLAKWQRALRKQIKVLGGTFTDIIRPLYSPEKCGFGRRPNPTCSAINEPLQGTVFYDDGS